METTHQRKPQIPEESSSDSFSRDRAPESPFKTIPALQELANTPSSTVPPRIFLDNYFRRYQYLAIVIPFTLLLGSIFGYFHSDRPSFYANKRNFLNVIFAKNAWGWTSLVFFAYIAIVYGKISLKLGDRESENRSGGESSASASTSTRSGINLTPNINVLARASARWALATAYWWIISRWFFGPGLFDRVYVITGGNCSAGEHYSQSSCRGHGGKWSGGFDISGHAFLLSHALLFLMEELSVYLNVSDAWARAARYPAAKYSIMGVGVISWIWWMMLFYTSVYHHSFRESFSGLFVGMGYWLATYVTSFKTMDLMPDQLLGL